VAQKQGKANALKEELFRRYFSEGTNIEDTKTLREIAEKLSIDLGPWNNAPFESEVLEEEVKQDIYNAYQIGARGVPFFVINEAYSLSGAHGADTLYKVIETARIKMKS
jgi:predicted DsbA family dithiol-disulfide isomerase